MFFSLLSRMATFFCRSVFVFSKVSFCCWRSSSSCDNLYVCMVIFLVWWHTAMAKAGKLPCDGDIVTLIEVGQFLVGVGILVVALKKR